MSGSPFAHLSQRLIEIVDSAAPALAAATEGAVVHGALSPANLWFDPSGRVTTSIGWQRACLGDIEQDWAPFVFTPFLGWLFEGYGPEHVTRHLQDDTALGRLEAHLALYLLRHCCRLAEKPRSLQLAVDEERARQRIEQLLTPGWLETQLADALQGHAAATAPPSPARAVSRWVLESLALDPTSRHSSSLFGALGTLELADRHPSLASGLVSLAAKACERLPANGDSWPFDTRTDTLAKLDEWTELVLQSMEETDEQWGQAAATLWLLGATLERLDYEVEPYVVSAIEEHLRLLLAGRARAVRDMQGSAEKSTHRQNLFHSLLNVGALAWMQRRSDGISERTRHQAGRSRTALRRAVSGLDLPRLVQHTGVQPLEISVSRLAEVGSLEETQWVVATLLAALDELDETWNALLPPDALLLLLDVKS